MITVFLLVGGWGQTGMEQALSGAHQAAARDLLERLLSTGLIGRAVVATDDPSWGQSLAGLPVEVDLDTPEVPFHFGRRLAGLIERHNPQRVLYSGGASAPLMGGEHWREALEPLARAKRLVVTNNVHSCDWVGLTPVNEMMSLLSRQESDNGLAWLLSNDLSWPVRDLSPSAAARFDLDTPTDLLIAHRHPDVGPHLRRHLDELEWESLQVDDLLAEMAREGGSLGVIGRVSPHAWAKLNQATRCWVRVFAEERGMRASGRQARGEVRSLLADYLDLVGVEAFFEELADLTNGVLFDNRVILAARGLWPSTLDRFRADLRLWEQIEDPFLRQLTRATAEAQVPILAGGHSVVAGGLMALVEAFEQNNESV